MAKAKNPKPGRYWVNDLSEFYWECVGPNGRVEEVFAKTSEDENRDVAQRWCDRMNRRLEAKETPLKP